MSSGCRWLLLLWLSRTYRLVVVVQFRVEWTSFLGLYCLIQMYFGFCLICQRIFRVLFRCIRHRFYLHVQRFCLSWYCDAGYSPAYYSFVGVFWMNFVCIILVEIWYIVPTTSVGDSLLVKVNVGGNWCLLGIEPRRSIKGALSRSSILSAPVGTSIRLWFACCIDLVTIFYF